MLWRQLEAIEAFGAGRPSDFGLCDPADDLPLMVGYKSTKSDMTSWENYLREKELEDIRRKNRS